MIIVEMDSIIFRRNTRKGGRSMQGGTKNEDYRDRLINQLNWNKSVKNRLSAKIVSGKIPGTIDGYILINNNAINKSTGKIPEKKTGPKYSLTKPVQQKVRAALAKVIYKIKAAEETARRAAAASTKATSAATNLTQAAVQATQVANNASIIATQATQELNNTRAAAAAVQQAVVEEATENQASLQATNRNKNRTTNGKQNKTTNKPGIFNTIAQAAEKATSALTTPSSSTTATATASTAIANKSIKLENIAKRANKLAANMHAIMGGKHRNRRTRRK